MRKYVAYVKLAEDGVPSFCEHITKETDFDTVKSQFASKWGLAGHSILAWRYVDSAGKPAGAGAVVSPLDKPRKRVLKMYGYEGI